MKKFLIATAATLALVSAPAYAQTFASTPGTYTFDGGGVRVQKDNGPVLTCNLTVDITNDGAGNITASNAALTGFFGLCSSVVFQGAPWTVTNPSTNVWRINGIYIDTTITAGDCAGYLDTTYTPSDNLEADTGFTTTSTIPEVDAGTGDCKIDGIVSWP